MVITCVCVSDRLVFLFDAHCFPVLLLAGLGPKREPQLYHCLCGKHQMEISIPEQILLQVICCKAGVWLPALNNSATISCLWPFFWVPHTFLSPVRSAGAFFSYLFFLPSASFSPRLYHAVMIHVLTHALTTRLHFLTVSNIVLFPFTLCRTWSDYLFCSPD